MSENIDKKAYYAILFEYYKELLTDKQIDTFICYYNEDYSLSEIASEFNVSRNAVFDQLKKTIAILEDYESKLKMYQKNLSLIEFSNKLESELKEELLTIIKE